MLCKVFISLDIKAGLISSSSSKAASAAAENNQLTPLIKDPAVNTVARMGYGQTRPSYP